MANPALSMTHVTSWISAQGGGIPPVIWALARQFRRSQFDCTVVGLEDKWVGKVDPVQNGPFVACPIKGLASFGYSPDLSLQLRRLVKPKSIVHTHGLWMHPGVAARKSAEATGSPLIISPHGMLEPWALENSKWKKRAAAFLFEDRNLHAAGCLHALCEAEAVHMREYGLRNPIAVIPNGVDLTDFSPLPSYSEVEQAYPVLRGKKRVLFLSRIHPKKGLPHLIKAWRQIIPQSKDWVLVIAGGDQLGHEQEMRSLATELGIQDSVLFTGPLYGPAKMKAMAGSDVFVLPSFSEGFSMAILEAAACGLPVLMTPQCNFPELSTAGGAIEVEPNAVSCEAGLRKLLTFTDKERNYMGLKAKELVERAYTWSFVADRIAEVYRWLLGCGPKPQCVSLN